MSAVKAIFHRLESVVYVAQGEGTRPRESVHAILENGDVVEGWRRGVQQQTRRR